MSSRKLRLSLIAMLALVVGVTACDSASNVAAPSSSSSDEMMLQNEMMRQNALGIITAQYKENGKGKGLKAAVVNLVASDYVMAESFGQGGLWRGANGLLWLYVPPSAVNSYTKFEVSFSTANGTAKISGTATSRYGWKDDVGQKGFNRPITIAVSAFNLTQPTLTLAYIENDGRLDGTQTVRVGNWLIATIEHFSDYVIAE